MTDAELIRKLRYDAGSPASPDLRHRQEMMLAAATRLEELTKRPAGSALSEARLAELRRAWADPGDALRGPIGNEFRGLLAGFDRERDRADRLECLLADGAQDQFARLARADGVAAALAVIRGRIAKHEANAVAGSKAREWCWAWEQAILHVTVECGPAELAPHQQTIDERRRYREALERIAAGNLSAEGERDVARTALGQP